MQVNQRIYLLSLFQSSDLQRSALHLLFSALVINKLTYAVPAYAGQLTADHENRINAIFKKGHAPHLTQTLSLTSQIANSFGRPLREVTVYTIFSP